MPILARHWRNHHSILRINICFSSMKEFFFLLYVILWSSFLFCMATWNRNSKWLMQSMCKWTNCRYIPSCPSRALSPLPNEEQLLCPGDSSLAWTLPTPREPPGELKWWKGHLEVRHVVTWWLGQASFTIESANSTLSFILLKRESAPSPWLAL